MGRWVASEGGHGGGDVEWGGGVSRFGDRGAFVFTVYCIPVVLGGAGEGGGSAGVRQRWVDVQYTCGGCARY